MTIKTCSGIVTVLGQSEYDMQGQRFAYVEIERHDGRILRAENVVVFNNVAALLELGVEGQFHFDAAMLKIGGTIRQLFGIRRSDRRWAYDAMQIRVIAAVHNIFQGLLLSLVVVGMPLVLIGLMQLVRSIFMADARRDKFFGGRKGLAKAQADAVIRI